MPGQRIPLTDNGTMGSTLRALLHVVQPRLPLLLSRSFSIYHAVRAKGESIGLRQQNPEAYKENLPNRITYNVLLRRKDPEAHRRFLDRRNENMRRWRNDPTNLANIRERSKFISRAFYATERGKFYHNLKTWCSRYAWFREDLPWKLHKPIYHEERVEHHCEGCNWTRKGGYKLWFRKISSPSTAEADSWLCSKCYFPKADCRQAMPKGYEDLTTIKEIAKRREELGHDA